MAAAYSVADKRGAAARDAAAKAGKLVGAEAAGPSSKSALIMALPTIDSMPIRRAARSSSDGAGGSGGGEKKRWKRLPPDAGASGSSGSTFFVMR